MCLNPEGFVLGAGSAVPPKKATPCFLWASGPMFGVETSAALVLSSQQGPGPRLGAGWEGGKPAPGCLPGQSPQDRAALHGAQPQTQGAET